MLRGKPFYLDKRNGKVMGVCAGIANHFGWDATLVRNGVVLVTLVLPIWLLLDTNYTVTGEELRIRSGPFRWRIALSEVQFVAGIAAYSSNFTLHSSVRRPHTAGPSPLPRTRCAASLVTCRPKRRRRGGN